MIAYLIMMHQQPSQFARLFQSIYHQDNIYAIHVDKRASPLVQQDVALIIKHYPNAFLMESEITTWGGYSLVHVMLKGIKALLEKSSDWQFFINLSGQDFPLRSQGSIMELLQQYAGYSFLSIEDQRKDRPSTLHRLHHFVTRQALTGEPVARKTLRPFLPATVPYISSPWMILARNFCEFVTHSVEVEMIQNFYRNTLVAEEGFFPTVLMNTSYEGGIVNDCKREVDWIMYGNVRLRNRVFTLDDANRLLKSTGLFARKFDEDIDGQILELLESNLHLDREELPGFQSMMIKSSLEH